jgi:cytochrome c-type biogenesis protein CcmE
MMNPARRRKLTIIVSLLMSLMITGGLVLYALRQNINLFYTPTQLNDGEGVGIALIRVGGMVMNGSIKRQANDLLAIEFKLTDYKKTVVVNYHGILPDLFRDGQGIVALGQAVDKNHFNAVQILAKHDANYMPPEVKSTLSTSLIVKREGAI